MRTRSVVTEMIYVLSYVVFTYMDETVKTQDLYIVFMLIPP